MIQFSYRKKKKHTQNGFWLSPPSHESLQKKLAQVKAKQKVDMSKQLRVSKTQGRINGIMKSEHLSGLMLFCVLFFLGRINQEPTFRSPNINHHYHPTPPK